MCFRLCDATLLQVNTWNHKDTDSYSIEDIDNIFVYGLNPNIIFKKSCEKGSIYVANEAIKRGANDWDYGLYGACRGGHLEIAKWMIEEGVTDWGGGLWIACLRGYLELVDLILQSCPKVMIEKGRIDLDDALHAACFKRHFDVALRLVERGALPWRLYQHFPDRRDDLIPYDESLAVMGTPVAKGSLLRQK